MQSYPDHHAGTGDGGPPFYSPTSSQHTPGPPNTDDIQLTAQLSRSLAPMMNMSSSGTMVESPLQRGHGNVNHHYEQDQDLSAHAQHMHGGSGSMDPMYTAADGSPAPRKRSKVSRACDECRRKKIRCDATGELGDENCSSCKRARLPCKFSRIPMKRGPSKGYIKELADRLNHLEGTIQMHAGEAPVQQQHIAYDIPLQRRSSDEMSPPPLNSDTAQRKRDYSAISGDYNSSFSTSRPTSSWPHHDGQRHLPQPSTLHSTSHPSPPRGPPAFRDPQYSPNGLPPPPQWKDAPPPVRRQSSSFESMDQSEQTRTSRQLDLEDTLLDRYYNVIHPTLPLLAQSKSKLATTLSQCSTSLHDAFNEALNAAMSSFPSQSQIPLDPRQAKTAAGLVLACQLDITSTRSHSANLVQLQTLMLMAIQAGSQPSNSLQSQSGVSPTMWLSSAVGLAYQLRLHIRKSPEKGTETDPDTEENIARRVWWSLVILDRWHASGYASPLMIPDSSVVLYREDKALLGDSIYQLARLSVILGHISEVNIMAVDSPTLSVPPVLGTILRGELERWREDLPDSILASSNAPLVHICFWLLRMLRELVSANSDTSELMHCASKVVGELTHSSKLATPLTYHAITLTALMLVELSAHESTKEDAAKELDALAGGQVAPTGWDNAIRDLIAAKRGSKVTSTADHSQTNESQHVLTASQGLQRLADIATAREEHRDVVIGDSSREFEKGNKGSSAVSQAQSYPELREIVRSGYLNALGGESGR